MGEGEGQEKELNYPKIVVYAGKGREGTARDHPLGSLDSRWALPSSSSTPHLSTSQEESRNGACLNSLGEWRLF